MHKRRHHHLYKHRLSAAIAHRQQRALSVHMKRLVADADRVVVIVQIYNTDGVYFAHNPSSSIPSTRRTRI